MFLILILLKIYHNLLNLLYHLYSVFNIEYILNKIKGFKEVKFYLLHIINN